MPLSLHCHQLKITKPPKCNIGSPVHIIYMSICIQKYIDNISLTLEKYFGKKKKVGTRSKSFKMKSYFGDNFFCSKKKKRKKDQGCNKEILMLAKYSSIPSSTHLRAFSFKSIYHYIVISELK